MRRVRRPVEVRHVALLLVCISHLTGCESREIRECIDEGTLFGKYGWITQLATEGSLAKARLAPVNEILVVEHERTTLSASERQEKLAAGHIEDPTHRPEYGDEFEYGRNKRTIFEFSRFQYGPRKIFVHGERPGERLYRTDIMRGFAVYEERKVSRYIAKDRR